MSYPKEIREQLKVIIVDDCGDPPQEVPDMSYPAMIEVEVYRIEKDIPWNQMGARNLGMKQASGWCLMLDPDMVFSADNMRRVLAAVEKLNRGEAVQYAVKAKEWREPKVVSPNTWVIHRDDFWAIGGYDEDFSGNKGWSDCTLSWCIKSAFRVQKRPDIWCHFYSTQEIPDAAVFSLDRSVDHNAGVYMQKKREKAKIGSWATWARKKNKERPKLRFPWKKIWPPS